MTNNRDVGFCNCGEQTLKIEFEDTYDVLCPNCNRNEFPADDSIENITFVEAATKHTGEFTNEANRLRAEKISEMFRDIDQDVRTIVVTFDGGAMPNPGIGYGSYNIKEEDKAWYVYKKSREEYGDGMTNNQAEYMALISAIKSVTKMVGKKNNLKIYGDSLLVIKQISGEWKVKEKKLKILFDELKNLLLNFEKYTLHHRPREESVEEFGH
tara:strand:- start:61 stop:696 length:636 start_codon:yes stop_codon:yes gene_type:complete